MEVVLPAPLTPATMITVGWCSPMTSGFSSGRSRSARASASSALTAAGSVALASLTRRRRSASRCSVALTPVSAISRASSSSSYSASLICVPVKTVAMLLPVLRRPVLRRCIQFWRLAPSASGLAVGSGAAMKSAGAMVDAGAAAGAGGVSGGAASPLPPPKGLRHQALPVSAAGAAGAAGGRAGGLSCGGVAGMPAFSGAALLSAGEISAAEGVGFFLKKLNIGRFLESQHSMKHALTHLGLMACMRSEEHTSELQSQSNLVCRLLLEKKKK